MWILTREINQYEQDGEYFVAAWSEKPTALELLGVGIENKILHHVEGGGGRINIEYEWYYLKEYKDGEVCKNT